MILGNVVKPHFAGASMIFFGGWNPYILGSPVDKLGTATNDATTVRPKFEADAIVVEPRLERVDFVGRGPHGRSTGGGRRPSSVGELGVARVGGFLLNPQVGVTITFLVELLSQDVGLQVIWDWIITD